MKLTMLDELLWALGFLSSVLILIILLLRGRYRRFPVFTGWIAFSVTNTILAYVVYRLCGLDSPLYAKLYWRGLWLVFALELCTVAEIARSVLRRNGNWAADVRKLFLGAAILGVILSAALCAWIVPPRGIYKAWELRGDLFTSLVICELLVSLRLIANWLRLTWDRHALAITDALTVWSLVSLVVNAIESYLGARYFKQLDYFQAYAWIGAMAWIAMDFAFPNPHEDSPASQRAGERLPSPSHTSRGVLPFGARALAGFGRLHLHMPLATRRPAPPPLASDEVQS